MIMSNNLIIRRDWFCEQPCFWKEISDLDECPLINPDDCDFFKDEKER